MGRVPIVNTGSGTLVYQSKSHTLLLLLVVLLTGVVSFQSGGAVWRDLLRDVRIEFHNDSIAIRDDAVMMRDSAKSAPVEFKVMWASLSYHVTALNAAAKVETRVAARRLAPRPRD
jgi:hypothetical protein